MNKKLGTEKQFQTIEKIQSKNSSLYFAIQHLIDDYIYKNNITYSKGGLNTKYQEEFGTKINSLITNFEMIIFKNKGLLQQEQQDWYDLALEIQNEGNRPIHPPCESNYISSETCDLESKYITFDGTHLCENHAIKTLYKEKYGKEGTD